jgi:hypothetical protein
MSHIWGDEWAYWPDLYKAGAYIAGLYERITKKPLCWKEKYGTLRYESTYLWLADEKDIRLFAKILKKAIRKYPQVAGEIVSDAIGMFENEYDEGWIAGVYWASAGSEWTSSNDGLSPSVFRRIRA